MEANEIIELVQNISPVDIMEKSKKRKYSEPRQLAMYLMHIHLHDGAVSIGKVFGVHYSTVINAIEVTESQIKYNSTFREKYKEIIDLFQVEKIS